MSGILLQQPRAALEGVSAHFSNMYCREDGRYSIFLGRRHNSCWTHSPQTRSCNKNGGVLDLFSRFRWGTENRGFIQIKKFFAELFQIRRRFILAKQNLGVRYTLKHCQPKTSNTAICAFRKVSYIPEACHFLTFSCTTA